MYILQAAIMNYSAVYCNVCDRTCTYEPKDTRVLTSRTGTHLLAGEQFALILVDDGVACGHLTVLIPRYRSQEVPGIGQSVGP